MKGNPKGARRLLFAGLTALAALGMAGTAVASETTSFTATVSPSKLSKSKFTPASVHFNLDISGNTIGGLMPSPLAAADVKLDRAAKIDAKGIPTCPTQKLENTTPDAARQVCKTAIIGTGFADAKVLFPGNTSLIDAPSPVTVFNGPPAGGNPVFIIHAYTTIPVPTTFVVPGTFVRSSGLFGRQIHFDMPPIAGGYGSLVHFDVTVNKKFKVKGKPHSYGSAKCKSGTLNYEGAFAYQDGFAQTVPGSVKCTPKA
jgi:hypothetical protein